MLMLTLVAMQMDSHTDIDIGVDTIKLSSHNISYINPPRPGAVDVWVAQSRHPTSSPQHMHPRFWHVLGWNGYPPNKPVCGSGRRSKTGEHLGLTRANHPPHPPHHPPPTPATPKTNSPPFFPFSHLCFHHCFTTLPGCYNRVPKK